MAINDKRLRKCFTFIWKLENASYCYLNADDSTHANYIESPAFTVDEINGTNWKLEFYPSTRYCLGYIGFFLQRQDEKEGAENEGDEIVEIGCEIALLSSDGTVLHSWEAKESVIEKYRCIGTLEFLLRNEVFFARRSLFLSQDTLTARCRMWKSVGEMSKDVQCFARTRIAVEKRSFLWSIENFSTLETEEKQTCEIKSLSNGEQLMSFDLFLKSRMICDEIICLKVYPNAQTAKFCTFRLSIVDASKNTLKCFQDEFWHADCYNNKDCTLYYTKRELMENKSVYLPNDKLSLWCECAFSCGIALEEIEKASYDSIAVEKKNPYNGSENIENESLVPKGILIEDFKSMLNDSILCDVKLKTSSQTYPAHKCILSVRSPVFKAMFSSNMKEKINDSVDIKDLKDYTVFRMLRYIYSADVGELEWGSATDLYEAGDKYQILNLKDICSSYLKSNLCANNACETLVLADLHQDEDLKGFVQDFVLRHVEDIINSEEWEQLAETNLKLAYETMLLKFKK